MKQLNFFFFFCSLILFSCKHTEEARKPVLHGSSSYINKSIENNKKVIASEEQQIKAVLNKNPEKAFFTSNKGYWYRYVTKNDNDILSPKKGDVVFFDYEIRDIKGKIIYTKAELKSQVYRVDKQNLFSGLRDGIKLMHKNEEIIFYFPSHSAFGYHGDNNKISFNTPIICTVKVLNFMTEEAYKKSLIPPIVKTENNPKIETQTDTLN